MIIKLQSENEVFREANGGELIPKLAKFDSILGIFRGFLTSIRIYFRYKSKELSLVQDQIIMVSFFLEGPAQAWFEPTMRNFLESGGDLAKRKPKTKKIFSKYDKFEVYFKKVFGDPDEK